ncbi:predicted protein [Plenodomus lingam JN3]|uniref:Predicted protein n=1 Tax=Leptosphaeria maculans (strain JN3 / isolate v23.1.3 / race Av1-4-5-6-7-8) TaxID=985895 RepID=E4ZPT2_LEPMJ|nr:predicted protein [Plenodomus lingam JN3]CBX93467.1 predicted protein [Plenodomus lingam JN3]
MMYDVQECWTRTCFERGRGEGQNGVNLSAHFVQPPPQLVLHALPSPELFQHSTNPRAHRQWPWATTPYQPPCNTPERWHLVRVSIAVSYLLARSRQGQVIDTTKAFVIQISLSNGRAPDLVPTYLCRDTRFMPSA